MASPPVSPVHIPGRQRSRSGSLPSGGISRTGSLQQLTMSETKPTFDVPSRAADSIAASDRSQWEKYCSSVKSGASCDHTLLSRSHSIRNRKQSIVSHAVDLEVESQTEPSRKRFGLPGLSSSSSSPPIKAVASFPQPKPTSAKSTAKPTNSTGIISKLSPSRLRSNSSLSRQSSHKRMISGPQDFVHLQTSDEAIDALILQMNQDKIAGARGNQKLQMNQDKITGPKDPPATLRPRRSDITLAPRSTPAVNFDATASQSSSRNLRPCPSPGAGPGTPTSPNPSGTLPSNNGAPWSLNSVSAFAKRATGASKVKKKLSIDTTNAPHRFPRTRRSEVDLTVEIPEFPSEVDAFRAAPGHFRSMSVGQRTDKLSGHFSSPVVTSQPTAFDLPACRDFIHLLTPSSIDSARSSGISSNQGFPFSQASDTTAPSAMSDLGRSRTSTNLSYLSSVTSMEARPSLADIREQNYTPPHRNSALDREETLHHAEQFNTSMHTAPMHRGNITTSSVTHSSSHYDTFLNMMDPSATGSSPMIRSSPSIGSSGKYLFVRVPGPERNDGSRAAEQELYEVSSVISTNDIDTRPQIPPRSPLRPTANSGDHSNCCHGVSASTGVAETSMADLRLEIEMADITSSFDIAAFAKGELRLSLTPKIHVYHRETGRLIDMYSVQSSLGCAKPNRSRGDTTLVNSPEPDRNMHRWGGGRMESASAQSKHSADSATSLLPLKDLGFTTSPGAMTDWTRSW